VFASKHLQVQSASGNVVAVKGWPEKATNAQKDQWIADFSDHAMLYAEVHA